MEKKVITRFHFFQIVILVTLWIIAALFSGCASTNKSNNGEMPYMDPQYKYNLLGNPELYDPWEIYPFMLGSVKELSIDDLTGNATFLEGNIYSMITKDGTREEPPNLPVGDNKPKTAELYLAKTDATDSLTEGDVIALAATKLYPTGIVQEIIKIHSTNGDFCHFTTRAPQPDNLIDKKKMESSVAASGGIFSGGSGGQSSWDEDEISYSEWIK